MNEYVPNRYKIMQKIGEGVHGIVLKAIDTTENKTVAIKMVSLRTKFGGTVVNCSCKFISHYLVSGISPNTLREIKSLQHADCEYVGFPSRFSLSIILSMFQIISMLDMYPDLSGLALVFEYMPHTLYSKLKDEENPLSRQQIQSYTKMLLRGLSYLHDELKIMHRVSSCWRQS